MKYQLFPPLSIYELGQRNNQEDALFPLNGEATSNTCLFVLCDGMGGHENGEVASQTVCLSLGKWFAEHVKPDCPFSDDMLHDALEYVYTELDKHDKGAIKKMGTTLTLLYMHRHGITAAHIGDSRIYHVRPGVGILYQSRDHSLVFDLFQAGEISYEEMLTHPRKNIITRAMSPGIDNRMRPDIIHITDILPDDWFYLCSDGMLEHMSNEEILSLFSSDITDEEKRNFLIKSTSNNQDNHTAWLIHVKDVIKEEGDANFINEEPTARSNAINIIPKTVETSNDDVVVVQEAKSSKSFLQRMKALLSFYQEKKK